MSCARSVGAKTVGTAPAPCGAGSNGRSGQRRTSEISARAPLPGNMSRGQADPRALHAVDGLVVLVPPARTDPGRWNVRNRPKNVSVRQCSLGLHLFSPQIQVVARVDVDSEERRHWTMEGGHRTARTKYFVEFCPGPPVGHVWLYCHCYDPDCRETRIFTERFLFAFTYRAS